MNRKLIKNFDYVDQVPIYFSTLDGKLNPDYGGTIYGSLEWIYDRVEDLGLNEYRDIFDPDNFTKYYHFYTTPGMISEHKTRVNKLINFLYEKKYLNFFVHTFKHGMSIYIKKVTDSKFYIFLINSGEGINKNHKKKIGQNMIYIIYGKLIVLKIQIQKILKRKYDKLLQI